MDGTTEVKKYHEALGRIAARLLALAVLAERAAGRSLPVRFLVLWLLRRAETAARAFAVEVGCMTSPLILVERPVIHAGACPNDAARLAQSFRALAAAFFGLSRQTLRLMWAAQQHSRGRRLSCDSPNAAWLHRLIAALRPRYADTS